MLPRLYGPRPRAVGAAALLAALLAPGLAAASDKKDISGDETLGGSYTYDTFTVEGTGTLHVLKLSADAVNGGWLKIIANTITLKPGAVIIADGAGYAGQNGAAGDGPAGSMGGGSMGGMPGLPGGGGGFFAAGANGSSEATAGTCLDDGVSGGKAFFDMVAKTPSLGAAGGAANVSQSAGTAGGNGGGGIVLSAAVITIDGTISAGGAVPFATGGVGPGGGAGGTIKILAAELAGTGKLQVLGGAGAHGTGTPNPVMPITANNGGGGSGGVIILSLPAGVSPPAGLQLQVAGGGSGDCVAGAPAGMVVNDALTTSCIDLDGDSYTSDLCPGSPGKDCDDSDPDIHPGAKEICDGKDNDCNGEIDDGADLCAPGSTCTAGQCVASADADAGAGDAGAGDAGAGGPSPDHIELGGGCALPSTPVGEGLPAVLAFGLGTLALAAGRRSRSPARARPRRR